MAEVDRDIGKLEAQVETLTMLVSEMGREVKQLREEFAQVRGGWKAVITLAAMAGGLFSWATSYFIVKH
jgi:hypothetical protein